MKPRGESKQPNQEVADTRNWHGLGCEWSVAENRDECAEANQEKRNQLSVVVAGLEGQRREELLMTLD